MIRDMEDMLSLEIKKEIADRYFGFRKMIEDDSKQYNQHVQNAYRQLENDVGFDLIRLYILLGSESLIHAFFQLTGLRDQVFLDPYLLHSPTIRQRLFKGLTIHGFTRRSRFHNLFFDIYIRLSAGVTSYNSRLKQLIEEGKAINKEIEDFHRHNDLGTMMGFLRRLDSGSVQGAGGMAGDISPLRDDHFAEKMRIRAPIPADNLLPDLPALPTTKTVRKQLQELVDTAYNTQGKPEVSSYST